MKATILVLLLSITQVQLAQELTPKVLLEKAVAFHDPEGRWPTFSGNFSVVMTTPNQNPRTSTIKIDLPQEFFKVTATRDEITTEYILNKQTCEIKYNNQILSEEEAKEKNMSCERGKFMKNYYTYLYGLPMKLNDPGTLIYPKVERRSFKGKEYVVLRASYDNDVGSDVWYFYFDPTTYAMEVYQFFRTDDEGQEQPDTGEYILLTEESIINGIKMPKVRAWYYNKNDEYLGTDALY